MWSVALIIGIPDEVFWTLAPPEIYAAIEAYNERERRADMRAGLVAATLVNVNRSSSSQALVRPEDFFKQRDRPEDYMSEEDALAELKAWAASTQADAVLDADFEMIEEARQ